MYFVERRRTNEKWERSGSSVLHCNTERAGTEREISAKNMQIGGRWRSQGTGRKIEIKKFCKIWRCASMQDQVAIGSLVVIGVGLATRWSQVRSPALGWVTVFGRADHLSVSPSHPHQLSLLPSAGREMSTSQSAVTYALQLGSKASYGSFHL